MKVMIYNYYCQRLFLWKATDGKTTDQGLNMKRFHRVRRFFNLVEVTLALGVTAMGVVGAMTILPFAMRTTQQTARDTYLCDAANMIFTEIDRVLAEKQKGKSETPPSSGGKAEKREIFERLMETNNEKEAANLNDLLDLEDSDLGGNGYTVVHTKPAVAAGFGMLSFYQNESDKKTTWELGTSYEKALRYSGLSANSAPPIFQVMYRIRITSIAVDDAFKRDYLHKFTSEQGTASNGKKYTAAVPEAYSGTIDNNPKVDWDKMYRRVYLEFSWPATSELNSRSTRTFIREYYYQFN